MRFPDLTAPFLLLLITSPVLGAPGDDADIRAFPSSRTSSSRQHIRAVRAPPRLHTHDKRWNLDDFMALFRKSKKVDPEKLMAGSDKVTLQKMTGADGKSVLVRVPETPPQILHEQTVVQRPAENLAQDESELGNTVARTEPEKGAGHTTIIINNVQKGQDRVAAEEERELLEAEQHAVAKKPFWTTTKKVIAGVVALGGAGVLYLWWKHRKAESADGNGNPNCLGAGGNPQVPDMSQSDMQSLLAQIGSLTSPYAQWFYPCAEGMNLSPDDQATVSSDANSTQTQPPAAGYALISNDTILIQYQLCQVASNNTVAQQMYQMIVTGYPGWNATDGNSYPPITQGELQSLQLQNIDCSQFSSDSDDSSDASSQSVDESDDSGDEDDSPPPTPERKKKKKKVQDSSDEQA